jgi:RNA polymerase sigma-70 factor (ECF subfamily)
MDPAIVERARSGDRAALEQLLEHIAPLVHRFGMHMCRHDADADDVLQDTLLAVMAHLHEFEGRSSLSSWVFTLARTACARRRRGLKNQPHASDEALRELLAAEGSPEQQVGSRELKAALDRALGALREDQREVLLMRDMEGLSAPEVARVLGLSVEAVKSRLHRARAALRSALARALEPVALEPQPGCPDILAAFSQKLEGDLAAEDCAQMEKHIEACPSCASTCSTLKAALWACRSQASDEVPPEVQARIKATIQRLLPRAQT